MEQTRNVIETYDASGKLTAAGILTLEAKNSTAFKYQSKASKFFQLQLNSLKFNPNIKIYIDKKLSDNKNFKFAYLAALYEGTSFVEMLNSVDTSGGVNYAAFQIGGKYYVTTNTGVINSGAIIYRILPLDPAGVDLFLPATYAKLSDESTHVSEANHGKKKSAVEYGKKKSDANYEKIKAEVNHGKKKSVIEYGKMKLEPLSSSQLDNIVAASPPNIREMIKPSYPEI